MGRPPKTICAIRPAPESPMVAAARPRRNATRTVAEPTSACQIGKTIDQDRCKPSCRACAAQAVQSVRREMKGCIRISAVCVQRRHQPPDQPFRYNQEIFPERDPRWQAILFYQEGIVQ